VILPTGTSSYFGVVVRVDHKEDLELTRALFGGTKREIEIAAVALAQITGRHYHEMVRLPRVTFSKTRNNQCDISGCLIPKEFPYVAFEGAQYDWSHVSLHGFYRLLSFLCSSSAQSVVRRALVEAGVAEDVLSTFSSNADGNISAIAPNDPFQ
jgi:hypothetical protein